MPVELAVVLIGPFRSFWEKHRWFCHPIFLKYMPRHDHSQLNLELDVCSGYLQNTSAHYFRVLSKARSHSFASPCFRPRSSLENRPPRAWDSRGLEKRHTYKSVAFSSADCSQGAKYVFHSIKSGLV